MEAYEVALSVAPCSSWEICGRSGSTICGVIAGKGAINIDLAVASDIVGLPVCEQPVGHIVMDWNVSEVCPFTLLARDPRLAVGEHRDQHLPHGFELLAGQDRERFGQAVLPLVGFAARVGADRDELLPVSEDFDHTSVDRHDAL